ncbi:MAG: hypothetical protein VB934_00470 [Polyangiaceae bacterium]
MRARHILGPLALCAAGCADPIRSDLLQSLGEEQAGLDAGPLHRAGQPCLACHGGEGDGQMVFSVAGTIYQQPDGAVPLANAIVHMADSAGDRYQSATNCAGNFFIQEKDYAPVYPAWVWIEFGGVFVPMNSPIFREGSCATCHAGEASDVSVAGVYFSELDLDYPSAGCP